LHIDDPEDGPPPPEDPPDWENDLSATPEFTSRDLVVHVPDLPDEQPDDSGDQPLSAGLSMPSQNPDANPLPAQPTGSQRSDSLGSSLRPQATLTPKLSASTVPVRVEEGHLPQILTVILRPTGDSQRDIRRISRLHGTFISYPGQDRFAFQIFEEGRSHLIEFPNDTTHLCTDLLLKIKAAVGEENLRLEPITYQ
jgi:hypothetical protein